MEVKGPSFRLTHQHDSYEMVKKFPARWVKGQQRKRQTPGPLQVSAVNVLALHGLLR